MVVPEFIFISLYEPFPLRLLPAEEASVWLIDAQVMNFHVELPLHLAAEDRVTGGTPVQATLVTVLDGEVHLDVYLGVEHVFTQGASVTKKDVNHLDAYHDRRIDIHV